MQITRIRSQNPNRDIIFRLHNLHPLSLDLLLGSESTCKSTARQPSRIQSIAFEGSMPPDTPAADPSPDSADLAKVWAIGKSQSSVSSSSQKLICAIGIPGIGQVSKSHYYPSPMHLSRGRDQAC